MLLPSDYRRRLALFSHVTRNHAPDNPFSASHVKPGDVPGLEDLRWHAVAALSLILCKAGVLDSRSGRNGGYWTVRPDASVAEVLGLKASSDPIECAIFHVLSAMPALGAADPLPVELAA